MAKSPHPNLIRCLDKTCGWETDLTRDHELPMPCPDCGGRAQVRCGGGLRGRPDSRRCRIVTKPGERCHRLHGGKSLKGVASPNFKTGEYSLYNPARKVPHRYRKTYGPALDDPLAQREMRHELAMMAAMEDELAERLDSTESGAAWRELQGIGRKLSKLIRDLRGTPPTADAAERRQELARQVFGLIESDLLPTIEGGMGEECARTELVRIYEKRARLIRVQQQGEDTVPASVLSTFQSVFIHLARKYIDDRRSLSLLVAELMESELPGWEAAKLSRFAQAEPKKIGPSGNGTGEVIDA